MTEACVKSVADPQNCCDASILAWATRLSSPVLAAYG
jgi:hypothetical protein